MVIANFDRINEILRGHTKTIFPRNIYKNEFPYRNRRNYYGISTEKITNIRCQNLRIKKFHFRVNSASIVVGPGTNTFDWRQHLIKLPDSPAYKKHLTVRKSQTFSSHKFC